MEFAIDYPSVDSKGCLIMGEDPGPWIEGNPDSRVKVRSLILNFEEGHDGQEIGDSIAQLTELTYLELIHFEFLKLPNIITRLHNLKVLRLRECKFEELPEILGQLNSLTYFDLASCNNTKSLPNTMKNLLNLKSLEISDCYSLTKLPVSLKVLHLQLNGSGIKFLPKGLINLQHLEVGGSFCFESSIPNLKDSVGLRHLTVICFLDQPNVKLPADLNKLANLQILSFYALHISELPEDLDGLANILLIDIIHTDIRCLPWSIAKLPSLKILLLPRHFRLQTLPDHLNDNLIISVVGVHGRKTWKELKTEMGPYLGGVECYRSTISSPSNYLRLKDWPSTHYNNVQFLELEGFDEIGNYICELPALTHLCISNRRKLHNLLTHHPDKIMNLRHLSTTFHNMNSPFYSLTKLSNLESLHLTISYWPQNVYLPASLRCLTLRNIASHYCKSALDSMAKLSNLKTLELYSFQSLDLLTANLNITKLKLIDCHYNISLPTSLRHLEILHTKECFHQCSPSDDDLEKCLKQLVNLKTLSFTCSNIKSIPSIAKLSNLQELLLKDCFSLEELPPNLDVLTELCTLNISGTRIKSLPENITKLHKLQRLILPKFFRQEYLPRNFKKVCITDDTNETYYERNSKCYYDFCQETSIETCNEGNDLASGTTVGVDEAGLEGSNQGIIAEQTSALNLHDTSNTSGMMSYYEHTSIIQALQDSLFHGRKDPIVENNRHASCSSQIQELEVWPSANEVENFAEIISHLTDTFFVVDNNQHALQNGGIGTMTPENEQGIGPFGKHISSCNGRNFNSMTRCYNEQTSEQGVIPADSFGETSQQALHNGQVDTINLEYKHGIAPRHPLLSRNMRHVDSEKELSGCNPLTESPKRLNVVDRRLRDCCSFQSPPKEAEHLSIPHCVSSEDLATLKNLVSLRHLAIKVCPQQHDAKELPANLNELGNLQTLSMECLHIKSLPRFAGLSNLQKLCLRDQDNWLEVAPVDLDELCELLFLDVHDTNIKFLPRSIETLQKLKFLFLPQDFRLETLPCHLNESVVISVDSMHIRKTWKELKEEMGSSSFCGVRAVEAAQNSSTISSSRYLRLKADPGQWIQRNYDSRVYVQSLELELLDNVDKIGNSIGELPELTYLYISGQSRLDLKHLPDISMTLRHLSLQCCNIESLSNSLGKLSNLEFLCLDLQNIDLPANLDLLKNLRCLSLRHAKDKSFMDSMAKLSYLEILDLYCCDLKSLPKNLNLAKLRLSDSNISSLPTGLHHLEILHSKDTCKSDMKECDVSTSSLNQLVNLEKLSVTCYCMESLPNIAGLHNLRALQLKDCLSLEALPENLDELVELRILNISGTEIKSLPDSIERLQNFQHLILPKCFKQDSLLNYLKKGSFMVSIDDTGEMYFKDVGYYDYDSETSVGANNEGNGIQPDSIEGVDEAFSNYLKEGSAELTSPQGLHATEVLGDICSYRREDPYPIGESRHLADCLLQNQEIGNLLPENKDYCATSVNNIPVELYSSVLENSQLSLKNEQNGTMTSEIEQRIASCNAKNFGQGGNKHLALVNWQNVNPQSDNVKGKKQKIVLTLDVLKPFWDKNMKLTDAAEQLGVSRSTLKRTLKDFKTKWPSSRKGGLHLDAKKRKHSVEATPLNTSSQQNLVNSTNQRWHLVNSTNSQENLVNSSHPAGSDNVEEYTVGANQLMSSNIAPDATMETVKETQIGTQCHTDDHQHAHEHLDGANECTLPNNIQQNESSSTFIVKAIFNDDIVRCDFTLTYGIELLMEELGSRLGLEVSSFKLKYQDEDGDWILVTRISDLEHALRLSKSSGSNVVRLLILPKT